MAKNIDSIKHNKESRAHIPSKEEAGYEKANPKVHSGKKVLEIPKNPVVHRGQDPELFWLNKYGNDDRDDLLSIDIRSLYRHEHIAPETLIKNLYRIVENPYEQLSLFSLNELFGNALEKDELEKVSEYYQHQDGWTNRLIQGDSHLVMASLLEREGMAGQVQMFYFDPPYGINYSSNWQVRLTNRNVSESSDDDLSGEPEVIKAFRDTWELGIHSYLSYLRDRLIISKELLNDTGSCFVQISAQNVHLVRSVMDEVFGSENFVSQIVYRTKNMTIDTKLLGTVNDFIVWYAKDKEQVKYRKLYQNTIVEGDNHWNLYQLPDGTIHKMSSDEINNHKLLPKDADPCQLIALYPIGYSQDRDFEVTFKGKKYKPANNRSWKFDIDGFKILVDANRIVPYSTGDTIRYLYKLSDYPVSPLHSLWHDTAPASSKQYVVQTSNTPIQRCIQMTTDPGDLVIDPTCGSGTTAFMAETYGRRWITIDTSRIALNIAKIRLMTAAFPYYFLYDSSEGQTFLNRKEPLKTKNQQLKTNNDIRQGFIYKSVPHITLESITGSEPSDDVTLFDSPKIDAKKLRVSGPFTVETLQNFEPISPEELDNELRVNEEEGAFEETIKQHLLSAGVKNGRKDEHVVFTRIELLSHSYLHAEGFYNKEVFSSQFSVDSENTENQKPKTKNYTEAKAYFHFGPKFGTVSKNSVNEAIKECRNRGDGNWLVILGFSFESDIQGSEQTTSLGTFEVTKARIHDDLLQEGLKKKPAKSAASFVTIGEPDVEVFSEEFLVFGNQVILNYGEIKKLSGLDSLAEINALSETDIYLYAILSQGRDVWTYLSDEEGFHLCSGKYSGGTGQKQHRGIPSISWNSPRFSSRIGNISDTLREFGILSEEELSGIIKELRRNKQVIGSIEKIAHKLNIILPSTKNQPLKTKNFAEIIIQGLDIYDPIKDEVKPRNLNDIAYWMVDDDYDGSNFVVKQVFFCGGDNNEFKKWQKGLCDAAKQSTRKKAEKTLKIEIDEEAFDRLYGYVSHPIEITKKEQKIAIRIISQFGEESSKIITI
jgi:adenine-specific DNA-methyltransferase